MKAAVSDLTLGSVMHFWHLDQSRSGIYSCCAQAIGHVCSVQLLFISCVTASPCTILYAFSS